jgi:hypothetical protein
MVREIVLVRNGEAGAFRENTSYRYSKGDITWMLRLRAKGGRALSMTDWEKFRDQIVNYRQQCHSPLYSERRGSRSTVAEQFLRLRAQGDTG